MPLTLVYFLLYNLDIKLTLDGATTNLDCHKRVMEKETKNRTSIASWPFRSFSAYPLGGLLVAKLLNQRAVYGYNPSPIPRHLSLYYVVNV